MARYATTCEIAGVIYTGCRAEIIDAGGLLLDLGGSMDWANDHTLHSQVFNRGIVGGTFGIQLASADIAGKLDPTRTAIQAAELANTTFIVEIADGMYNINANCIRDMNTEWLTHGKHSEGWYETIVMRFGIKSAV